MGEFWETYIYATAFCCVGSTVALLFFKYYLKSDIYAVEVVRVTLASVVPVVNLVYSCCLGLCLFLVFFTLILELFYGTVGFADEKFKDSKWNKKIL